MAHQVSRQWEKKTRNWEDAKSSFSRDENVLSFSRSPQSDHGATALNLVYQAAEVFGDMEEHARETEARAQSLCKSAVNRLQLAEKRIEVAERARREVTNDAECKLQDASRALRQAQKRIVAAEDQVTALEFRAQTAEAQLRETKQALLLVEEAIRTRLLSANSATVGNESTSAPRFVTV